MTELIFKQNICARSGPISRLEGTIMAGPDVMVLGLMNVDLPFKGSIGRRLTDICLLMG